jgi:hypothetical protein
MRTIKGKPTEILIVQREGKRQKLPFDILVLRAPDAGDGSILRLGEIPIPATSLLRGNQPSHVIVIENATILIQFGRDGNSRCVPFTQRIRGDPSDPPGIRLGHVNIPTPGRFPRHPLIMAILQAKTSFVTYP